MKNPNLFDNSEAQYIIAKPYLDSILRAPTVEDPKDYCQFFLNQWVRALDAIGEHEETPHWVRDKPLYRSYSAIFVCGMMFEAMLARTEPPISLDDMPEAFSVNTSEEGVGPTGTTIYPFIFQELSPKLKEYAETAGINHRLLHLQILRALGMHNNEGISRFLSPAVQTDIDYN